MTLRLITTLTALLALAGCADSYVQNRPPLAEFRSALNPDESIACLTGILNSSDEINLKWVAQIVSPGKDYYLVPTGMSTYLYSVSVKGDAEGSTFRLYNAAFATPAMHSAMKRMLQQCTERPAAIPG